MNAIAMDDQRRMLDTIGVVQSTLGIPLIEIEQLNPRMRQFHGAMVVKYYRTGGNIDDPESVISYEYEYIGGEVVFIQNPYPRRNLGTGRVAYLVDDENDPTGKAVDVPENAMSGYPRGWNRELLASHYGDCYWKIVDPGIDEEIRARYRQILINKGMTEADADACVQKAVDIQKAGIASGQKVVVKQVGATPYQKEKVVSRAQVAQAIATQEPKTDTENDRIKSENTALRSELSEVKSMLKSLLEGKAAEKRGTPGRKKAPAKKPVPAATKSETTPEISGNLGG